MLHDETKLNVTCFVELKSINQVSMCDCVKFISRTLYKQGPYGGRPVIRRSLIITPGSLVKVSIFFYVSLILLPRDAL